MDAPLCCLLLVDSVPAGQCLAGYLLTHDDHIHFKLFAEAPNIVDAEPEAAFGAIAHYHVDIQVGKIVHCLLTVFGRIGVGVYLCGGQAEHMRYADNAPAVKQPVGECGVEFTLNAPYQRTVAYLGADKLLVFVALVHDLTNFSVDFKIRLSVGVKHACVVNVTVEVDDIFGNLRIRSLVYLQYFKENACLLVEHSHVAEVGVPIPLFARLLLNEPYRRLYLVDGILQHQLVLDVLRGGYCKARLSVAPILDAVAHERGVAGGVAVEHTFTDIERIILNAQTQLGFGHCAHIARYAEFLGLVDIAYLRILRYGAQSKNAGDLRTHEVQVRKAEHYLLHHVFVHNDHFVAECLAAAYVLVGLEHECQRSHQLLDYKAEFHVRQAKLLTSQPLVAAVEKVGCGYIIEHPAIAQKALQILEVEEEFEQHSPCFYPTLIIKPCIGKTSPFTAHLCSATVVEFSERFAVHPFSHQLLPPCSLLISTLSTNA